MITHKTADIGGKKTPYRTDHPVGKWLAANLDRDLCVWMNQADYFAMTLLEYQ